MDFDHSADEKIC